VSLIVLTPKGTVLGLNHVIRAIKRDHRPRGSNWALDREKRTVQDRTGNKSSAVAKIGDRLGTINMGRKEGAAVVPI